MPQAKTVLQSVATNFQNGYYFVQLSKQIVADNGDVMWSEPHNVSLAPAARVLKLDGSGDTVDMPPMDLAVVLDAVDAHLAQLGFPAISADDRATISTHDTVRPTFPLAV